MRRLRVADAFLHRLDLVFDMAVGDEDVLPAVVIVVEEKAPEAKRNQRRAANFRARSFIHKQPIAFVVVERKHLVRKISNDQAGAAGAVVIRSVNAHTGARHTIFAEPDAGRNRALFKRAVLLIHIKFVGLRVVRDQDVGPSIVVVIENGDAESLRSRIVKASLLRGVFELAVAEVMPEASRRSLIRFGRAVRLMRTIKRAIEVGLLRPLHIVGDDEIEFAVAIVIDPGRAGRELARPPQSRGLGHVGESSVAVVVEEMALSDRSNKNVVEAVVVVVTDGDAKTKERNVEARFARHIGESAVVVVVIELQRSRAVLDMAPPILPVDEEDVRPAVVVVVNKRAARAHGFRQPLLPEGSIVMGEMNALLIRYGA